VSVFLHLLAWTPLRLLYVYADVLHFFAYHVLRWRLALARRNIAGAFPELRPEEREAILRQSYRQMARTLMEMIWASRAPAAELGRRVQFDNPELIEKYQSKVSVVLLTAHVCNWEWLLLAAGARFDVPIDAVYKPLRLRAVENFTRAMRARFGGQPIPIDQVLFELLKRGAQARGYGLLADQTPLKHTPKYWIRFLNRDTAFFLGPERLARYLDGPVLYVEMRRTQAGHYRVHMQVLAEPPYDDPELGAHLAEAYARRLEATIRAQPSDWLWIHNKWKYPRPAPDAAADAAPGCRVAEPTRAEDR
jgi:KDO2-lipid IV(A) lauroyltransferase